MNTRLLRKILPHIKYKKLTKGLQERSKTQHSGGNIRSALELQPSYVAEAELAVGRHALAEAEQLNFDPKFYQKYYGDLANISNDQDLAVHFMHYGRAEGRCANPSELLGTLQEKYGSLPADFNSAVYRKLHSDLADKTEFWQLCEHYLRYGRAEKRAYGSAFSVYISEFKELKAARVGVDPNVAHEQRFSTFELMLESAGLKLGAWLSQFMLYEFALLNQTWLPCRPQSRMEGITLFAQLGVDQIAPISLSARFEPGFYRARSTKAMCVASDADLYRDWLNRGFEAGEACCQADVLQRLIGTSTFPACFNEAAYRACLPPHIQVSSPGRVAALEHFVVTGFADADLPFALPGGQEAAALLEGVAEYHLALRNLATAKRAFDAALVHAPRNSRLLHRRGDTLKLLSQSHEATQDFATAAAEPGSILWSHIHAAEGLAEQPNGLEAALDRVLSSAPRFHGDHRWRAAGHAVLDKIFAEAASKANALYRDGFRAEADAHMTSMLDRLIEIIPLIDPLPAPLPEARNGSIVIIANLDLPQCKHYRVEQKRSQLEYGGWTVSIFDQNDAASSLQALNRAAAVIFYRVASFRPILHAILYARALGLKTIYEIDDLIFDAAHYPDPFESFEGQITEHDYIGLQYGVPLFRYAMCQCDVGLASTPALAEAMRPLVRSNACYVLRNGLDERNVPFLTRPQHKRSSHATVTIFYGSGTKAHNKDFTDLAAPALLHVLERYPTVRVVVAGYLILDDRFARFADRVRKLGFTSNITAYWEVLSDVDINLAVLAPTSMADAKSEIKWLEAAMCGVPSIVSNTRTYGELLTHGEDALIAAAPDDWTNALDHLVRDPLLRRQIGESARQRALANYGITSATEILSCILPAAPDSAPAPVRQDWMSRPRTHCLTPRSHREKPRILIVNVYFPPQAVGGATRVVQNNLDNFIDYAGDSFDFAVVTVDENVPVPNDGNAAYDTRIDAYRGVPVYRISAPMERNMIWRPFNSKMSGPFNALLERFEPDLVHFHCVQRLTATVVEEVQARSIPYVVTVHDAWWISDFQFLVDENGEVQKPSSDPFRDIADLSHAPIDSLARRLSLKRVLDGAHDILAVSEYFAGVYRQAGFAQTRAIPNGVPPLEVPARIPAKTRHIRLGHIGGRTTHKGATLVEFVLRANSFNNLALTLVDHSQDSGYRRDEIWGTTQVQIIGFVQQDQIPDLYNRLDVLLAPSLWPESFGLVTREAQAAGLWVVASDRGAIGEEVTVDVDGFRVNVDGPEQLTAVLAQINADPSRFTRSPPNSGRPVRSMKDQAHDVISIYNEMLLPR